MATLYELTGELLQLLEMAKDEGVDLQTLEDTMDMVEGDFKQKADGYGMVLQELIAENEMIDKEIQRLQARKKRNSSSIERMKSHLQGCMVVSGLRKFQTGLFNFLIRKSSPRVVIDEVFVENIPEEYLVFQDPAVNKTKIKEDLKAGKDIGGVAHLEAQETLVIT